MSREIGLSRLTVFELEDANTPTYTDAVPVPWVVSVEVSKTMAEFSVFADNVAEISSSKATGAELTIEISSDCPPSLEARLTGTHYANGMMMEGTDSVKPSWGVAYETVMDTGRVRRYFFTNCTISKNEQSNETISDSITAQTYSLTVNAIPLPVTKELMFVMDENDKIQAAQEATDAGEVDLANNINTRWDEWFETAPRPVEIP